MAVGGGWWGEDRCRGPDVPCAEGVVGLPVWQRISGQVLVLKSLSHTSRSRTRGIRVVAECLANFGGYLCAEALLHCA